MFYLLKLTALALVVTTSSVHALDERYVLPALRGSANNEMALVELQDRCQDGTRDGRRAVNDLWNNDCANAWGLAKSANRMKDRSYPSTARNPRDAAYNKCARDAIDKEVKKVEKKCLEDSSSECEEVGELAASVIVNTQVCNFGSPYSSPGHHNYKKTCRTVATGICQGQITAKIRQSCPRDMPGTSALRDLQNKCSGEVKSLTPNNGDFDLSGIATIMSNIAASFNEKEASSGPSNDEKAASTETSDDEKVASTGTSADE